MLTCNEPLELYATENGIDDRDNIGLSGFNLKVNKPPAVSINFISGEYDGAINGVKVDLPFSIFQFWIESKRCKNVSF